MFFTHVLQVLFLRSQSRARWRLGRLSAFVAIVFEATGELLATRLAGLHYFRTGMAKIDRALLPAFG
jgi:hypothetical protein